MARYLAKNKMLIKVKVFPNAKKEKIIEKDKDSFEVYVKEKAKEGKANKRVLKLISLYFKLPEQKIRLIRGVKERNKIFFLKNH